MINLSIICWLAILCTIYAIKADGDFNVEDCEHCEPSLNVIRAKKPQKPVKCIEEFAPCDCGCCSGLYCLKRPNVQGRICVELDFGEIPPNECRLTTTTESPQQSNDSPSAASIPVVGGLSPPEQSPAPSGGSTPGVESIPVVGSGLQTGSGGGGQSSSGSNGSGSKPGKPKPNSQGRPNKPKPGKPGKPNKPWKPGRPGKPNRPGRPNKPGRPSKPSKGPSSTAPIENIPIVGDGLQQGAETVAAESPAFPPTSDDSQQTTPYVPSSPNFGGAP